jgi:radical SAM protein with 4Fe4S-binding SPASM domain
MNQRVLYLNVTRQCNIHCRRCYLTEENRRSAEKMPISFVQILGDDYYRSADEILVIVQGGEATILGESYLNELCAAVKEVSPRARITAVVNLYHLPAWLLDISQKHFGGRFETTFAMSEKTNLTGWREGYLDRFTQNLKALVQHGMDCPVNVELNRETYLLGPQALANLILETRNPTWEFDVSLDFESFRKFPRYNRHSYPEIPGTLKNQEFSDYLLRLYSDHAARLIKVGFKSSVIDQVLEGGSNRAFNVQREADFITVNADGTVTTNPLFSDLVPTYIGNLKREGFEQILIHPNRLQRIAWERRRVQPCASCDYFEVCRGGPSHVQMEDGSGECAGMFSMWAALNREEGRAAL